jgi:hypothetical protein
MLTHARLLEIVHYDPETGVFTRLTGVGSPINVKPNQDGYLRAKIDGRTYMLHRIAWFYVTGEWPEQEIDHRNARPADNRFKNLREATASQNNANRRRYMNSIGFRGVRPWGRKYIAKAGKTYLGLFTTPEAAHAAYVEAAQAMYGEFAEHLSPLQAVEVSAGS